MTGYTEPIPSRLSPTHRGCSLLEVEGALNQRQRLTAEVSALGEEEQRLEQLIQRCSLDVRHMSELQNNQKYPFAALQQQNARLSDPSGRLSPMNEWMLCIIKFAHCTVISLTSSSAHLPTSRTRILNSWGTSETRL